MKKKSPPPERLRRRALEIRSTGGPIGSTDTRTTDASLRERLAQIQEDFLAGCTAQARRTASGERETLHASAVRLGAGPRTSPRPSQRPFRQVVDWGIAACYIRTMASNITIEVWDATGNKKQLVELPAEAPVNRVIAVLVERMNLPRHSPDGQLMSYKFQHRASGRQLLDEETLAAAGVRDGDIVRLQPEITAGSRRSN